MSSASFEVPSTNASSRTDRFYVLTALVTTGTFYFAHRYYVRSRQQTKESEEKEEDTMKKEKDGKGDDLTDFNVLAYKLQSLAKLISEKTGKEDNSLSKMSPADAIVVFASLCNFYGRIESKDPDFRAKGYENSATTTAGSDHRKSLDRNELDVLKENLEYADWAYETNTAKLRGNLAAASYFLVRHDASTEPGRVAHFVAMDDARKRALVSFKGSSTASDLLTDLVLHTAAYELSGPFNDDGSSSITEVRCHEGILKAALTAVDELCEMLEKLFLPLGYDVVLCGHSLGAGTAALVGLLLRARVPALRKTKDRLRVYAYAPPPVLNYEACAACESFVTSVVDNSDIIPRFSVPNIVLLDRMFNFAHELLVEQGTLSKDNPLNAVGSLMNLGKVGENLCDLDKAERYLKAEVKDDHLKDAENLYVPGRVVLFYRTVVDNDDGDDVVTEGKEKDDAVKTTTKVNVVVTNGGCGPLRMIEMVNTLLTDHMVTAYAAVLDEMKI